VSGAVDGQACSFFDSGLIRSQATWDHGVLEISRIYNQFGNVERILKHVDGKTVFIYSTLDGTDRRDEFGIPVE